MPTLASMKIEERYQYLRRMQPRYRQANRQAKRALLDEMEAHTGLHRKSLTRRLNSTLVRQARRRERGPCYGPEVDAALSLIWEALDVWSPTHRELALPPSLHADLAAISCSSVRRHLPSVPPALLLRSP